MNNNHYNNSSQGKLNYLQFLLIYFFFLKKTSGNRFYVKFRNLNRLFVINIGAYKDPISYDIIIKLLSFLHRERLYLQRDLCHYNTFH